MLARTIRIVAQAGCHCLPLTCVDDDADAIIAHSYQLTIVYSKLKGMPAYCWERAPHERHNRITWNVTALHVDIIHIRFMYVDSNNRRLAIEFIKFLLFGRFSEMHFVVRCVVLFRKLLDAHFKLWALSARRWEMKGVIINALFHSIKIYRSVRNLSILIVFKIGEQRLRH